MSFPHYPEYKNSGIDWLGTVPKHWGTGSMRWLTRRYSGGTPDKNNLEYWEQGTIPWLNSGAVNDRLIKEPSCLISREAFENSSAKWIPTGALVMALAGQGKTKGMVAQLSIPITCNQSMAAIVPGAELDPRFLYWWLDSNYQNIRNMAGGDLRDGLNLELLGNIQCPLPQTSEQEAIAAFLDSETAKIDALIAEQEQLIALLKEKRQAVISHAVTKGLNPVAPMTDSGVEWLGDIPSHWKVTRLKYATSLIVDCPHETPTYSDDGEYLVIRTADIGEGRIDESAMYRVDESEYLNRIRRQSLLALDIVYGREGERWGHAALVPADDTYCLGQRMMQFRAASHYCPKFLMWLLNAETTYLQGQIDTVGATSPHVNVGTIRNYALTEPPYEEQVAIGEYLRQEAEGFDGLMDEATRGINLLKERRAALISAAVTGKIDVRGFA